MGLQLPIEVSHQQVCAFIVLGEELHYGRTADRLMVTQPHVSRTIVALERRIGGRLVDRTSRRVRLTPLGESFHTELTAAYEGLAEAVRRAKAGAAERAGVLVVGCTATTATSAVTSLVAAFEARHPQYRVRLHELPLTHPYEALRIGTVDVLLHWLPDDAPGLTWGSVIETQPMMMAMRAGHPLSSQVTVSIEALADYGTPAMADLAGPDSVAHALWPATTPAGRQVPRVGPPCGTMSEIIDVLARTDAVKAAVTATAVTNAHRADLAFLPIVDAPPLRLGPIWPADRDSPAVRAFAAAATRWVAGTDTSTAGRRAGSTRDRDAAVGA